ncbi:zinc ribbon domain-containing protein [Halorubrum sp. SD626R]|uniref:zinc ribbon domain-containing protein n=1 Tax=Halorubrum sp. SD626R TaxID=1419722 RepID=UPI000A584E2B|nr:zinc ribbon domain-containing protein [Halorubrum sp. SD626R]TKX81929.1 zinc ribbon domain-containing protein [Halorubrum sp. SD626R]
MKTCPRCESSIDDEASYCVDCGAPQTEAAAEELDEYVQRQAQQIAGDSGGGGDGFGDGSAGDDGDGFLSTEELTDREQLWRRGCYVAGYGTVVVALTLVPQIGAFPLILGGIAILPPVRRLTAEPLGSPLKREVMAGLYAVLVLIGAALLFLL